VASRSAATAPAPGPLASSHTEVPIAEPEPEVLPEWPPPLPEADSTAAKELNDLLGATTYRAPAKAPSKREATTGSMPLRLPDGSLVLLGPRTVVGRNPSPDVRIDDLATEAVRLPDPDRALSRQHLAIRVLHGQVTVEDLGSTNGSAVEVPGRGGRALRPGEQLPVPPATVVLLGGSVRLVVDPR